MAWGGSYWCGAMGGGASSPNENAAVIAACDEKIRAAIEKKDSSFSFQSHQLSSFPESLFDFHSLQRLTLQRCSLQSIPPGISRLVNIHTLELSGIHR